MERDNQMLDSGSSSVSWKPCRHVVTYLALLFVVSLALARICHAGSFLFANESNGLNLVTHPHRYDGSGGKLKVSVCIDPSAPFADEMVVPVKNVVDTFNSLNATNRNSVLGSSNNIPSHKVDFETVALHEVGHCVGLAHPNRELGTLWTQSTPGGDREFDVNAGPDGVRGSSDDRRGDDRNLHWFRQSNNNPFTIAGTVDESTYSRSLFDLPSGDDFATNANRRVAGNLFGIPNTEAVMHQGVFVDEARRDLQKDDVATFRYGMSGLDERSGTGDEYVATLEFAGKTTSCDVPLAFDNDRTSFAVCVAGGEFVGGSDHARMTVSNAFFNSDVDWFFNQKRAGGGFKGGVFVGAGDIDGDGETEIVTGPGEGGGPHVRAFNPDNTTAGVSFMAYNRDFRGGARVASCDVNDNGTGDVITGAGPGGGPHVRVFDGGDPESRIHGFFAYSRGFDGGVFVACGDVNGDGIPDIVTGAGAGGGPHVKVFDGRNLQLLHSFFAYKPGFRGGVFVGAGDVNGDGFADVITGAGEGGGPHVRVFDGRNRDPLRSFFAYNSGFRGGVRVAGGDVDADGIDDIITGAGPGGGPHVRAFDGLDPRNGLASFFAYGAEFGGGVFVATGDVAANAGFEIITGAGAGGGPHVRAFSDAGGGDPTGTSFFAY